MDRASARRADRPARRRIEAPWRRLPAPEPWSSSRSGPGARSACWPSIAAELEDRVLRAIGRLHAAHPRHSAIPASTSPPRCPTWPTTPWWPGSSIGSRHQGKVVADAPHRGAPRATSPGSARASGSSSRSWPRRSGPGGISPPDVAELAASAGARAAVVPDLLALLRDEQRVVEINAGLYLDADVEAELRRKVRERLADGSAITMAELRDLLGTTRKYAVPIGEYLDRIGLTRREGDLRRLGDADRTVARPSSTDHDLMLSHLPH